MVAYTSPDCLPYFAGTDSPCLNTGTLCDPSTVWCDFAEIVEARLDEFDAVVARTADSVPIAWVETTEAERITVGGSEFFPTFTTVKADTDDMVNLDEDSSGFVVNTAGLYVIFGYAIGVTTTVSGNMAINYSATLSPPNAIPNTVNSLSVGRSAIPDDVAQTVNVHFTIPVLAGQTITAQLTTGGSVGDFMTFSKISLGAAWIGDLPV